MFTLVFSSSLTAMNATEEDCWNAHHFFSNIIDKLWVKLPLLVCYWLIFALGLIGNSAALFAIIRYGTLKLLHGPYLLGLTVSSLILTLAVLPAKATQLQNRSWAYGETTCVVSSLLQSSSLFAVSLLLCAIAFERYISIVNCTKNNERGNVAHFLALAMIAGTAVLLSLHYFFYVKMVDHYTDGNDTIRFCQPICGEIWPSSKIRRFYNLLVISVQFCMPIAAFVLCYEGIIRAFKRQMRTRLVYSNLSEDMTTSMRRRWNRLSRMTISLIFSFVLPWAAHNFLIIAEEFDTLKSLISPEWLMTVTSICHCIAMTFCIWNPLVYALYHPDIRSNLTLRSKPQKQSGIEMSESGFRQTAVRTPCKTQSSDIQLCPLRTTQQ